MRSLTLKEIASLALNLLVNYRQIRRAPFMSRQAVKHWQFERIKALVAHAYNNVPYYREKYESVSFRPADLQSWDDFHRLPLLSKDEVIANFPQAMLQKGACLEELIVSRSSGSSGKVLDIAYDSSAMIIYILAGLRLYNMGFTYRPWHRQVYIYTSPYPLNSLFGLYPLSFIPTLTPQEEVLNRLKAIKPDLLVCYPSHLKQLAEGASAEERRTMGIKAISVNSEMSTQAARDYLSQLFDCPVLDEYSSEELTRIAAQCSYKKYHIFEDINYLETIDQQGVKTSEIGTIVGTNLHNFVMPMIRYRQEDRGQIEEGSCDCGWQFRLLTNFEGRSNDSFIMPSGRVLSSGFLLDATYDFLLTYRGAIKDFCLIQRDTHNILLQVLPGADWNDQVSAAIAGSFRTFLEPEVNFKIVQVQECEKTKSGKRNPIINLMNRAQQTTAG